MRVVAGTSLTLDLEPGLLQRFPTLRDCVHWTVLNDPRGIKAVAADCDLSPSELTRRVAPTEGDPRSCDVNLMVLIMQSTQDFTPIYYQMARFLTDEETKRRHAIDRLDQMMPELARLLDAARVESKRGRR